MKQLYARMLDKILLCNKEKNQMYELIFGCNPMFRFNLRDVTQNLLLCNFIEIVDT